MGVHQEKSVLHDELHAEKNVEHLKQLSQLLKREMEHFGFFWNSRHLLRYWMISGGPALHYVQKIVTHQEDELIS